MTLTEAAHQLLIAAESGSLEVTESAIGEFTGLVEGANRCPEIPEVLSMMRKARMAIYAQRAQIVLSLQNEDRCELYAQKRAGSSSWEFSA